MARALHHGLLSILALFLMVTPLLADDSGPSFQRKDADPALLQAKTLVEEKKFAEALLLLKGVVERDPKGADGHNLLGFSHRKLGDRQTALAHYKKALALDPSHRGANEYLGELYLEMGDLAKAEERLDKLDSACFFGCEEYTDLKQAIAAYKAKNGQ